MKVIKQRKVLLLLLLCHLGTAKAQQNAEWFYEFTQSVAGSLYYVGYEHYASVGDTLIQGKDCMIVKTVGGSSTDCEIWANRNTIYVGKMTCSYGIMRNWKNFPYCIIMERKMVKDGPLR